MKISIAIEHAGDGMSAAYATQIKEQHALQPFEDAYALSGWMHKTFQNNRLTIHTSDNQDEITVSSRAQQPVNEDGKTTWKTLRYLTINCY